METLTRKEFWEKVNNLRGTNEIFGVKFIKRSTGEERTMSARFDVKKHLKGGPAAYDPNAYNLLWVFDMVKSGYRSIPVEGVFRFTSRGTTYKVISY